MKRHSQKGSAHLGIVIVVILVLIGALGYVFYQNFMNRPVQEDSRQNAKQQEEKKLKTARVDFEKMTYALDYPEGWSESALGADPDFREMSITNPDKTIEVVFNIAAGGLGGMCDTEDGLKVRFYQVSSWTNTKVTNETLHLVEAMTDYPEGGYGYVIGLSPEGAETHSSIGDSRCTVGYVGVASRVASDPSTDTIVHPTIIAKITFPGLPDATDSKVKSMDDVKNLMATDDYKAAVKILQSARKE